MYSGTAFLAGIVSGSVLPLVMLLFPDVGKKANPALLLGTATGAAPSPAVGVIGFLIWLLLSGLIAIIYAWGFERVQRAGWLTGAAFSIVHMAAAVLVTLALPAFHPLIPERLPPPGAFFSGASLGPAAFVLLHLVYGTLVGGIYGRHMDRSGIRGPVTALPVELWRPPAGPR